MSIFNNRTLHFRLLLKLPLWLERWRKLMQARSGKRR